MAFFRCGTGGGESGYTIYITTEDSNLYGYTITISKNGTTVGTTSFDNQGEAEYTVEETGTYTVSVTYDGVTYSKEVVVSAFEVSLATGFVLDEWLEAGDVSGTYADLSEVLADEEAVRKLMSVHDAVDYLASFTDEDTSVIAILNNDLCAKWITCKDYAEDTLTAAYGTLMASIGKYGYGEWALQAQVPKMTSNTAPIGEVTASSQWGTNFPYWKAFDGSLTTGTNNVWAPGISDASPWIAYKFIQPYCVTKVLFSTYTGYDFTTTRVQVEGRNNSSDTWTAVSEAITIDISTKTQILNHEISFTNQSFYKEYCIHFLDAISASGKYTQIVEVQFYAWQPKNAVPIMTSATAPYGEAFSSSNYSGQTAYMMFDGSYTSYWTAQDATVPAYVGYAFPNPVAVKRFELIARADNASQASQNCTCKFQGSNTGANDDWHDVTDSFTYYPWDITKSPMTVNVATPVYYLRYRLLVTVPTPGYVRGGSELRMYGRQMKALVPVMSGDTAPYGEASAKDTLTSGFSAYMAFDGNINNAWCAGTQTSWVQYKLKTPMVLKRVRIYNSESRRPWTGAVKASNDGVNFTILYDEITMSTGWLDIDIDNNVEYEYYRLDVNGTNASYPQGEVFILQFYGEDYSELDWDANYPRHYIYDRGLELETLTLSGTASKEVEDIRLSAANAQASVSIDTTDYTLLRGVVYDRASGTNALLCGSGSANFVAGNMPYLQGLDVSSINGLNATGVKQTGAGDFTVESLWLE